MSGAASGSFSSVSATGAGALPTGRRDPIVGTATGSPTHVKVTVLNDSIAAALLAAIIARARIYRRTHLAESVDQDHDDIPDGDESD